MAMRSCVRWPHRGPQTVLRKTTVNFQPRLRMDRPSSNLLKAEIVLSCLPTDAAGFKCHRDLPNYLRPSVPGKRSYSPCT